MRLLVPMAAAVLVLGACKQDMIDQPKHEDYETSALFPDGKVQQAPVDGTVARGDLAAREALDRRPPLTRALLARGQERFGIYCTPCHGRVGDGEGMVVRRGFPQPPSLHDERLRQAPAHHFVSVITLGKGDMFSYAARVPPTDRWAIAAYIKALQLSQQVAAERLPDDLRAELPAEGRQ